MVYDRLWEIAVGADWRLISDAVGGFVVVAVLIWRRTRIRKQMQRSEARLSRIESQLSKMKNEIDAVLRIQVSLITRLNAQSKARLTTAAEMGVGDAELTISPATVLAQPVPTAQRASLPGSIEASLSRGPWCV
jgi:hypothetical protein